MTRQTDWSDAPPEVRSDWWGLSAFVCSRFRDFERAEKFLLRAESQGTDRAWLQVERSSIFEAADRLPEAEACARKALVVQPYFRPAVQALVQILQMTDRRAEAVEVLRDALDHIEAGLLAAQLAGLYAEREDWHAARKMYDRFAELSPMLEPDLAEWLAGRRADVAYSLGDREEAAAQARANTDDHFARFADRLEADPGRSIPDSVRVDRDGVLATRWVDTTSAVERLARAAGVSVTPFTPEPQPEGLPDPAEDRWLTDQGLVYRVFTPTEASLEEFLRRGVPVLVGFVQGGFAYSHLVVGIDPVRRTVRINEPAEIYGHDVPFETWLGKYDLRKLRALVVARASDPAAISGVEVADEEVWGALFRLQTHLAAGRLDEAGRELRAMRERFPGHPLVGQAELALTEAYGHPARMLSVVRRQLADAPEDMTLLLAEFACLREVGSPGLRKRFIDAQVSRTLMEPAFLQHQILQALQEMRLDGEALGAARQLAHDRQQAPYAYYLLGQLLWEMGRRGPALDALRHAATLDDKEGQFAEAYFRAARARGLVGEATRCLQAHETNHRGKLGAPARCLYHALSEQDQEANALEMIEANALALIDAARANPTLSQEAGTQALFVAEVHARHRRPEPSHAWLERARPLATPEAWHAVAGRLAVNRAEPAEARGHAEKVLESSPLDLDALKLMARCRSDLDGRPAALVWLRTQADRFPDYFPLQQLLIDHYRAEELRPGTLPPSVPVLERVLERCDTDAWVWRELALNYAGAELYDKADEAVERSARADAEAPQLAYTRGYVLTREDKVAEAKRVYLETLERSPDHDLAIGELVQLARGDEERKEVWTTSPGSSAMPPTSATACSPTRRRPTPTSRATTCTGSSTSYWSSGRSAGRPGA